MRLRVRLAGLHLALLLLLIVGLAPVAGAGAVAPPPATAARPSYVPARAGLGTRAGRRHPGSAGPLARAALQAAYGRLPLSFELNQGQAGAGVSFVAHSGNNALLLGATDAVLALSAPGAAPARASTAARSRGPRVAATAPGQSLQPFARPRTAALRLHLLGANPHPRVVGEDRLPGVVNYLIGNDRRHWRTHIATYARVVYKGIYPGIDLAYHGTQGRMEYDFIVHPGARPDAIRLAVSGRDHGASGLQPRLDARGNLALSTAAGTVRQAQPVAYQVLRGTQLHLVAHFVRRPGGQFGFSVGRYDTRQPLVIDPVLVYGNQLPGNIDGITIDRAGNVYATGSETLSTSNLYPSVVGPTISGTPSPVFGQAEVLKLSPGGSTVIYETILGGSVYDPGGVDIPGGIGPCFHNPIAVGNAIAVDGSGSAYVGGYACESDFPTTPGAFEATRPANSHNENGFVVRLTPDGSALSYSTYLGVTSTDPSFSNNSTGSIVMAIAVNPACSANCNAVVTGWGNNGFPLLNAVQTASLCCNTSTTIVTELNATGSGLVYSTYFGGSSEPRTSIK